MFAADNVGQHPIQPRLKVMGNMKAKFSWSIFPFLQKQDTHGIIALLSWIPHSYTQIHTVTQALCLYLAQISLLSG